MSNLAALRTALVAALASVPDIGQVHDHERYVRDEAKFRELYLFTPASGVQQVRGWWLRRKATQELSPDVGTTINCHTWQVRGYMSFNDAEASELVFDELVEAIREVLRNDPDFLEACALVDAADVSPDDGRSGAQVVEAGPVMFCGVLCHSAVLEVQTWSYT